jgi:hypothetical protein
MSRSWRMALVVGAIVAVFAATSAGATKFITGGDIKNGSIGLRDLSKAAKRGLKGKTGPAGPAGAQGPTGPQGPAGPASITTTVRSQSIVADGTGIAEGDVQCPPGMVATGGSIWSNAMVAIVDRPTSDGTGWSGVAGGNPGDTARVFVICTPGTATIG